MEREIPHAETRPELERTHEDHYDCERDVNPNENANRPERLKTLRCILKQVVQSVTMDIVDERAQKQSPCRTFQCKTKPVPLRSGYGWRGRNRVCHVAPED